MIHLKILFYLLLDLRVSKKSSPLHNFQYLKLSAVVFEKKNYLSSRVSYLSSSFSPLHKSKQKKNTHFGFSLVKMSILKKCILPDLKTSRPVFPKSWRIPQQWKWRLATKVQVLEWKSEISHMNFTIFANSVFDFFFNKNCNVPMW